MQIIRNILSVLVLFLGFLVYAGNPGVTYQGRIFKPDGTALESASVQFRMQVRSSDGLCLLYEETQTKVMTGSLGIFAITMNDGSGTRLDTPSYTLDRIFANRGTFTLDATRCSSGTTYTPASTDGRQFVVYFKDNTMASYEPLPIMTLNFSTQSMYALEAQKLGNFAETNFLRAVDVSGNPAAAPAFDPTQLGNLNSLIAGTSTQYTTTATFATVQNFAKSALPTCAVGEVLKSNGTAFSCVPAATGGTGTVTSVTSSNGYLTVVTGTTTPGLTVNVGTTANTLAAGDDSRITGALQTGSAAGGSLAGTYPNPTIAAGAISNTEISNTAAISDSKLATISTAGKVSGSAITSGTIGGSTVISTSGNIKTTGSLQIFDAGPTNSISLKAPSSVTSSYVLTFPSAAPTTGQQLVTVDGAGTLGWAAPGGGGTVTNIVAGTGLTGGTITSTGTIGLGTELTGLNGLATTGFVKRTAAGTYSTPAVSLTADISGVLPVANGGTNSSATLNGNSLMISNGGAIVEAAAMTDGQIVVGKSGSAPQLVDMSGDASISSTGVVTVSKINGAAVSGVGLANTNILQNNSGSAISGNSVLVSNAGGTGVTSLTSPASGVLTSSGTVPSWSASVPATQGGTGQTVYTVGDLLYASTTSALSKLPASTSGYVLTSNGAGTAPSWQSASTGLPAVAGTAAAPGYAFSGNTNTGMFGAASNQIGFSTNGVERARIDSSGNVGIGTAAPIETLHVAGTTLMGQIPASRISTSVAVGIADTTITVASTTGYPSSGTLSIDGEAIHYTGTTATTFTGCTRGYYGTTATTHSSGILTEIYTMVTASSPTAQANFSLLGGGGLAVGYKAAINSNGSFFAPIAMGAHSSASGVGSVAIGPWSNASSSTFIGSVALGYQSWSTAAGAGSLGYSVNANSYTEVAFGESNLSIGTENSTAHASTAPILVVGNGTAGSSSSNSLVQMRNGQTIINSGIMTTSTTPSITTVINNSMLTSVGSTADSTAAAFNATDSTGASMLYVRNDSRVGIGTSAPGSALDIAGAVTNRGMAAPALSAVGQGTIYFDSTANKFKVSQNGAAYTDLVTAAGGGGTVTSIVAGTGLTGGTITSTGTIGLGTELTGLNGLATTGFVKRTAAGTYSTPAVSLTADISGVLPVANGGTNSSTGLSNNRLMVSSAGAIVESAAMLDGQLVVGKTGSAPQQVAMSGDASISNTGVVTVSKINGTAVSGIGLANTNILQNTSGSSISGNSVLVSNAGGTGVTSLTSPASGVLTSSGTVPSWSASVPATQGGTGQTAYTVGDLLYASTTSALSKLPASTSGYVLTSNGAGVAPTWQAAAAGGGALSALTAATTGHTISNGANAQVWNWQLSGNTNAFSFGESTASTGGTGTQNIVNISNLASSTATPLNVVGTGTQAINVSNTGSGYGINVSSVFAPGVNSNSSDDTGVLGSTNVTGVGLGAGVKGIAWNYGYGVQGTSGGSASGYFQSYSAANTAPTLVTQQLSTSTADLFQAQNAAGTSVFRIDTSGGVSAGSGQFSGGLNSTYSPLVTYTTTGLVSGLNAGLNVNNYTYGDSNYGMLQFTGNNAAGKAQTSYIAQVTTTGASSYSPALTFGIQTSSTAYGEKMRIDSTGNVGIGTVSPGAKLEISSGVANTSGLKFTNFTSTAPTGTGQPVGVDSSGNLITIASGGSGTVTSIVAGTGLTGGTITSTGTIGLGTELTGLNGLATTGFVKRTAAGTYSTPAVSLTADISGVLPVANGGTNSSTGLSNNRLMISSGSAIVEAAAMTDGQFLVGKTGSAPQLVTMSGDATVSNLGAVTVSKINGTVVSGIGLANTNILQNTSGSSISGNSVLVSNAGGTGVTSLTSPASGVLVSSGTVPSWSASVPATQGGTGQTAFTIGDILYASSTSALSKLAASTSGYVLTSNGAGVAPSWQAAAGGGGSVSGLTAATVANTIDNLNFAQAWNFSTATTQSPMSIAANTLTTGSGLNLTTSSTSLNSTNGLLNVANTGTSKNGMLARFQANSTVASGVSILANGNVGIGTTTPVGSLDIESTAMTGTIASSGTTVTGTGTNFTTSLSVGDSFSANGQTVKVASIASATSLTTTTAFSPVISSGTSVSRVSATFNGGTVRFAQSNDDTNPSISFGTKNSGISGYVGGGGMNFIVDGVNTIDVTSSGIGFYAPIMVTNGGSAGNPDFAFGLEATGMFHPATNQIAFAVNSVELARITSTGIGISATAPAGKLDVNQTTAGGIAMQSQNAGTAYWKILTPTGGATNTWNAANAIQYIGKDTGTSRSINAAGTINASGADFAEWVDWSAAVKPEMGSVIQYKGSHVVVSSPFTAAFVGNDIKDSAHSILVAFAGQLPVLVRGVVHEGDLIVALGDGTAKAVAKADVTIAMSQKAVGTAWEASNDPGLKRVNVAVGIGLSGGGSRDIASLKEENEKLKQDNLAKAKEMAALKARLDKIEKALLSK